MVGFVFTERGITANVESALSIMEERPLGELDLVRNPRNVICEADPVTGEIRHRRYVEPSKKRHFAIRWVLLAACIIGALFCLVAFWFESTIRSFEFSRLESTVGSFEPNAAPSASPTVTPVPSLAFTPAPSPTVTPTPLATPTPTAIPAARSTAASLQVIFSLGLALLFLAGLTLLIWNMYCRRRRLTEDSVPGWQDSVRRSVRVSIGETRCLRETVASETGLLIEDDLKAYPHLGCVFYRLEFSLTMLPDPGCSVERGQLSLELIPDNEQAKLPFFVRLHPEQEIVEEKKKLTRSGDGKATFKIPTIGEIEGGGKMETESELQVETVVITSWGAGEQLGGWRFNASATRSIKTNITGLTALVAIPEGRKSKGRFRAAAHLRRARKSADLLVPEPEAFIEYEFPPTLEIPSTALPVSDPVPV
jgi:hypothetical protein